MNKVAIAVLVSLRLFESSVFMVGFVVQSIKYNASTLRNGKDCPQSLVAAMCKLSTPGSIKAAAISDKFPHSLFQNQNHALAFNYSRNRKSEMIFCVSAE